MTTSSDPDHVIRRKFGRLHETPCADPNVLTCSLWQCQQANRCKKSPALAHAQRAAPTEGEAK
jgi:hypothetical protein